MWLDLMEARAKQEPSSHPASPHLFHLAFSPRLCPSSDTVRSASRLMHETPRLVDDTFDSDLANLRGTYQETHYVDSLYSVGWNFLTPYFPT
jgi:hypothetical protein